MKAIPDASIPNRVRKGKIATSVDLFHTLQRRYTIIASQIIKDARKKENPRVVVRRVGSKGLFDSGSKSSEAVPIMSTSQRAVTVKNSAIPVIIIGFRRMEPVMELW
jgi:hypothetical protein